MFSVLHVNEDHSDRNPGVTRVVNLLAGGVNGPQGSGHRAHILAAGDETGWWPETATMTAQPLARWGDPWRWCRDFTPTFRRLVRRNQIGVVHLHGVWMAPQWLAAREAWNLGIPFIVTAHGMLEPWNWSGQGTAKRLKKELYWRHVAYPAFRKAAVIHAITPLERENLQPLFPGNRFEVIPNAIDVQEIDDFIGRNRPRPEPIIVFLGRIHPKKGIEFLIDAFAKAGLDPTWRLVIAGPPQDSRYYADLLKQVGALGLDSRVEFVGSVQGAEKYALLSRAWVMVTPSHSEAVGMVNLEASTCRTPTLTTRETGLWDWEEGGGRLIRLAGDEFVRGLAEAAAWSDAERIARGEASRALIERRYSMRSVGERWSALYRELSDGAGAPRAELVSGA